MAVNRKFPEYVILVNPTTLQPYVASGGGGVGSSVNILDALGNPVAAGNPFPITGTVTVGSLPSVTVVSLPSLPAGSNLVGKVDINSLPSLPAGAATIGNVTVSSLPALPAGANLIGSVNIANSPAVTVSGSVPLSNAATADYDSGAGTAPQVMIGLALPASGGPVAGGTVTNPLVVNVNNTPAVTVSGAVTVAGTVTANQAGTWNVTVNTALPAGSNVIGGVTQSGSPWGVKTEVQLDYDSGAGTQNLSLVGIGLPASGGAVAGGTATNPLTITGSVGVTGAVTANQGGAPWSVSQSGAWAVGLSTGANVIGAVTQSGTWTVQQGTPPWSITGSTTPVPTRGSFTDHSGSIAAGGAAQSLAIANSSRVHLFIQNNGVDDLWFNFGATATVGEPSIQIPVGADYTSEPEFVSDQSVSIISATAGVTFTCKEA